MERKEREGQGKRMGRREIWKVEEHRGLESDAIEKGKKERWILQVQGEGRKRKVRYIALRKEDREEGQ